MERAGVVVVGASAAGLAAAWAAARAGADVTLLEARDEVGFPAAPAIVGFDHLWPADIRPPASSVRRRLPGARLRAPDGLGPLLEAPLALFDRTALDRWLAAEAERAGARIQTGVRGLAVEADAALRWDAGALRPRIVVFADGPRTLAQRFLRPTREPDALAWGAILEVDAPDDDRLTLTFGSHAPGGRSQLNPLGGGRGAHWTFFRGAPERAEAIARGALELDARLSGWKTTGARFAGVAPDPVFTVPGELAKGDVMVAGGAAGQGGLEVGLASGWMAGETAARAARGETTTRAYETAWRARYQKGYARLRRAADALAHLTDGELARLFSAWDGRALTPTPSARLLAANPKGALALAWSAWLSQARS